MSNMPVDFPALVQTILEQYRLPPTGVHGVYHWARVWENGLRLAEQTGADPEVVRLFALFHDACRVNEAVDPGHGARGARLAEALRGRYFELDDKAFACLVEACERHTDGLLDADVTVQTCWDADRLDLARVGIRPVPSRLCTPQAREEALLAWAVARSVRNEAPRAVLSLWGLDGLAD